VLGKGKDASHDLDRKTVGKNQRDGCGGKNGNNDQEEKVKKIGIVKT